MKRLLVTLSVLALAACGGSETGQTPTTGEAAPVEAAPAAKAPQASAAAPQAAAEATPDPQVQSCLDLIAAGSFEQALPVCLAALKIDPTNQQVRDAVDQARAETAKLSASAAAEAAAGSAGEGATSKLGEAVEGLPGGPPQ